MAYIGFDPFKGFSPFTVDTFVGDGTTLTFSLSLPRPTTPRSLLVMIDGVMQPAVSAYGLDGSFNLLFTEAPPLHSIITVVHLQINGSDTSSANLDFVHPVLPLDQITFDGTAGPWQLKSGGLNVRPYNEYYTVIYVAVPGGNYVFRLPIIDYTINTGGQIAFTGTPPESGANLYGVYFGKIAITEVIPGSLNGDAFGSIVDFGSRNVYVDDPMDAREVANKEWVEDQIAAATPPISTTDDLTEGTTNLYYTPVRARSLFNGTGLVTYNPSTGEINATLPTYLANINQALTTTASPYFVDIHATGNITASGNMTTATGTVTADAFVGNAFTGDFIGQVSDITNHTISELADVDTTTIPPVNGNVLLWSTTANNWKPGYVPFNQNNIGNITGSQIFDATSAAYFTATVIGNVTVYFTFDTTSPVNVIMIELTNGGAYTVTWPASTKWPSGAAPTLTTSGVDLLVFVSRDGGTTWRGMVAQQDSR